jgi:hypothetical protein
MNFKKWQKRWEQCISAEDNYFEGDGSQYAESEFLTRWQHQCQKLWMPLFNSPFISAVSQW